MKENHRHQSGYLLLLREEEVRPKYSPNRGHKGYAMICRLYSVMSSSGILYRCIATPEKKSDSIGVDVAGAALEVLVEGVVDALLW